MAVVDSSPQKTCFDLPRATCNLTQDVVGMPALFGIAPPALQLTSGLTIVRGVTAVVRGYDDVTQRANDVWKKVNGGLYIFRGFCDFVAGPINTFIAIAKNFAKWSPAALPVLNTIASIATAVSLVGLAVQCGIDCKQATTKKDKVLSVLLGVTASLLAVTILLGDILTVGGISKGLSIANLVLGGAFCIFDGMQLRDGLKATDQKKHEMLFKLMMVGATVLLSAGIFAAGQFLTGGTLPIILRIATMAVPIITTSIFCRKDIEDGCKWLKQKITPLGGAVSQTAAKTVAAVWRFFKPAAYDYRSRSHTVVHLGSDDSGSESCVAVDAHSAARSSSSAAAQVQTDDDSDDSGSQSDVDLDSDDSGSDSDVDLDNQRSPAAKAAADDVDSAEYKTAYEDVFATAKESDSDDSGPASDYELEA
jgi:hypothetical protein